MIVVVDHIPGLASALAPFDEVRSLPAASISNDVLRSLKCTALFVRTTTRVDAQLLDKTNVRFIGTASSGSDHIDVDLARSLNITVCAAPGCNALAVTEYVLYAILRAHIAVAGKDSLQSLQHHRIGIVGFGKVGRMVARACTLLGISVLLHDPPALERGELSQAERHLHSSLEDILHNCTIVTNHVPKTSYGAYPTLQLFDGHRLSMLNTNAIFIHSSRGGVVNEQALSEQKMFKNIFTAIDVWDNEPAYLVASARAANISTPHIAGHSVDATFTAAAMMYEAYVRNAKRVNDNQVINLPSCLLPQSPAHRRRLDEFADLAELCDALEASLDIPRLHQHMTHPEPKSANLSTHFLHARNSYTSRREIITLN